MGVLDWFQSLPPAAQSALLGGGMNILGGALSGMGQQGRDEASQANQLAIARMNNLAGLYGADNQRYIAAQNAIGSPLAIQRERAGMAMLGDMLGSGGSARASQQVFAPPHIAPFQGRVGGGSGEGGPNFSRAGQFLTNDAMVNAEVPFWQNLSALNPDINPNLQNSGYGGQNPATAYASGMIDQSRLGNMSKQAQERQAIMGALGGGGMAGGQPPEGYEYDKKTGQLKKKGGGFWKKLGKIGAIVGGGIATAMTGGAASPLLAAAIGAGSGALAGGIDGGWKGALTGGALGGLTGGIGAGSAGTVAKQGLGQAVKSTLTNPRLLTRAAGAGIGGGTGAAMQLGSTFLPENFSNTVNGLTRLGKVASPQRISEVFGQGGGGQQNLLLQVLSGQMSPGLGQILQQNGRFPGQTPPFFPQSMGMGGIIDSRSPQQSQMEFLLPILLGLMGQGSGGIQIPKVPNPYVLNTTGSR